MDEYHKRDSLPNKFIHNKLPIYDRMADWGTQDPRQGLGFFCLVGSHGFDMVGHFGPHHEVGQAVGLRGRSAH